jgi:GH24 family phage-related lysozyme (muramidase)
MEPPPKRYIKKTHGMLVNESVYSFLNEEFIAQETLNEKFDINTIKDKAKKIAILATMFLMTASNKGFKDLPSKKELMNNPTFGVLASQRILTPKEIQQKFENLFDLYFEDGPKINYDILQDPMTLKTSPEGMVFIKDHEKLRLDAYTIGDGMITVGWGHAEPQESSQWKEGQTISEAQAAKLFGEDIKTIEIGIRDLFRLWKSRGLDIKISQNMWDSMVSMAFNMGVDGLRGSEMILSLRDKDYLQAADSILTANVDPKFPGLEPRREEERELFLKGLI